MPKLDITPDEQVLIIDALKQAESSAKRQQNMKGKTLTILTVYKEHERILQALQHKIAAAK